LAAAGTPTKSFTPKASGSCQRLRNRVVSAAVDFAANELTWRVDGKARFNLKDCIFWAWTTGSGYGGTSKAEIRRLLHGHGYPRGSNGRRGVLNAFLAVIFHCGGDPDQYPFLTGMTETQCLDGARHAGLCAEQGEFLALRTESVVWLGCAKSL